MDIELERAIHELTAEIRLLRQALDVFKSAKWTPVDLSIHGQVTSETLKRLDNLENQLSTFVSPEIAMPKI